MHKRALSHYPKSLWKFTVLLLKRSDKDGLTLLAGHLAYVSLLSLVPLIAVVFSLFALFPVFSDISAQLKTFIFSNAEVNAATLSLFRCTFYR